MKARACLFAVTLVFLVLQPAPAQVSDQQLVDNAYPTSLDASREPDVATRFSTFVAADLMPSGESQLVALYTNGVSAIVRVLDRSGRVLSQPDLRSLKGFKGDLEAVDLDGDGVPEIIVRLYSGHGLDIPDSWVFAWRNSQLSLISPVRRVHALDITLLSQIVPIAMDDSGKMAILAFSGVRRGDNGDLESKDDGIIYQLRDGQYVATDLRFMFAETFFRHTGAPKVVTKTFSSAPVRVNLRIVNGVSAEGGPVDSAHVMLNGAEVAGPSDFKPKTRVIVVPVQLASNNQVSVQLEGKPGSGVWVIVDSAAVITAARRPAADH